MPTLGNTQNQMVSKMISNYLEEKAELLVVIGLVEQPNTLISCILFSADGGLS